MSFGLHSRRVIVSIVVLALILRCVSQGFVPLMHQEAYYWMYAQHPSLSYFDHPPMVAWVITLGTAIFGDNEWGVRAVGGTFMLVDGLLMFAFARLWWSRRVTIAAALLLEMAPVYFGIGLLATMDSALMLFWLIGLIGFSLAVRRGSPWAWYLCGFGLGGALLSKYTGVFLIPGVGLLLLAHRPWRKWLISPHPYLAVALGVAMFSPVLVWNAQHDWASFRFQFMSRFDNRAATHKNFFLEFLGFQILVVTPIVIGGAFVLARRAVARRRLSGRGKVAFAFAVPFLLSIAIKSWTYPVHIDWTAPAYLSLIPASLHAVDVLLRARRTASRRTTRADVSTLTLPICIAIDLGLALFLLFVQPRTHSFSIFGPWDQLAATVEHYEDDLEARTGREPFIIVDDKYELASLIAFYRNRLDVADRSAVTTVNRVALDGTAAGFAFWADRDAWPGKDCIYVDEGVDDATPSDRLASRFASVRRVWTGNGAGHQRYTIFECLGYRAR